MSKAEKTKEYIIERSAALFNRKGYAGTSLSDIINITGLTKGSIYGNFENKDEVAVAVYNYNIATLRHQISEALKDHKTATDKLVAFTRFYRTNWKNIFEHGGCPIQNASVEADDNLAFLKKSVQDSIKNWVKSIGAIIESGQRKGEFKPGIQASEYAYVILTMLEGGIMLAKIMNNQNLLFSALDRIVVLIDTELKK